MPHSNGKPSRVKVKKPRVDFPLFPHATGRWAKKVRGRFVYFGKTADDPTGQAAHNLWVEQKEDLLAGRTPVGGRQGLTVCDLCNRFMTVQEQRYQAGEIVFRTFDERFKTCKFLVDSFGKRRLVIDLNAGDFETLKASICKRYGLNRRANLIGRIRSVFKYGYEAGLIDQPVRFGPTFKKPPKRAFRQHQQKQPTKTYKAAELLDIINAAPQPLKAMTLLGINGGFGNHDVGTIPETAINLKTGWVDFPRPKTAVERRCPLWPETIEAIKESIALRPEPAGPQYQGLAFLTPEGKAWSTDKVCSTVSKHWRSLLTELGIHRKGVGFYGLRHSFETFAGGCCDQVAVDAIMGHADPSMAANYRHGISDERLEKATNAVRSWLFGGEVK